MNQEVELCDDPQEADDRMLLGYCARMKVSHLPLREFFLSFLSILILKMNVLIWNCQGALMIIIEIKTSGS